jgi:hypothetical protein
VIKHAEQIYIWVKKEKNKKYGVSGGKYLKVKTTETGNVASST